MVAVSLKKGRRRYTAKQADLERPNAIDHNAFFWWVDGLVDIDKLTDLSPREIRLKRERRATGQGDLVDPREDEHWNKPDQQQYDERLDRPVRSTEAFEGELRDLRNDPRNHRVRDTDANYIPALQLREK